MEDYELRLSGGKPPQKRRRNIEQLTKLYVDLVAEAISSSPAKTMMVGEICGYLKAKYGCGKSEVTLKVAAIKGRTTTKSTLLQCIRFWCLA